jgi:hypothetical protein
MTCFTDTKCKAGQAKRRRPAKAIPRLLEPFSGKAILDNEL